MNAELILQPLQIPKPHPMSMIKRSLSCRALAGLMAAAIFLVISPVFAAPQVTTKPNILIFYVDDMGYGQLQCYGNKEIPTPNISALAASGVRFTQGYVSAPLCSPSRAGLMSGHYQERFAHDNNSLIDEQPLPYPTLAERLKKLGYDSSAVGKWHLGAIPGQRPAERGFSEFYGTLGNPGSYFKPKFFIDSRISPDTIKMEKPGFYTTDAYTDRSVEWITKHHDKPWFLYLAYNAVHSPHEATKKYLDRFPDIKDQKLRVITAMFSALDDGVGRVMKTLKDTGQDKNTLVFFISDNGSPYRDAGMNGPLRGYKWETWEGGIRVPFMMSWPGKLPAGVTYDQAVINLDVMPTVVVAAGGKVDPAWGLDGVDLMPYITGKNNGRPNPELDWRLDGRWAARVLDLKLVHMPATEDLHKPARANITPPELYDLSKDIGETHNLANSNPEDVQRLKAQWDAWNSKMAPAPPYEPQHKSNKNKKAANSEQ